jgi:bifunctional DNase/RNase
MQDLYLGGMSWCAYHGCPVVALRPLEGDDQFWITFSPQEAEAMAAAPLNSERNAGRVYQMLEAVTDWLDANVSEVRISRDGRGVLNALVTVEQAGRGSMMMPVSTTEGIVMAWRNKCPIRIDDATLAHIRRSLQPTSSFDHFGSGSSTATDDLNPTIVDFIQSLDMDWPEDPDGV